MRELSEITQGEHYTGTPSEKSDYDPEFFTDSSTDAILLKELKSIIQEHSTHRLFPFFELHTKIED